MLRLRTLFPLLCLLSALFISPLAYARDGYDSVSWKNLVRTLVRFNAINLASPEFLKEYAIVTECDLYQAYYNDEFKWNRVLMAIKDSVEANKNSFPQNYDLDVRMQLDRYDFEDKRFRFTPKTALSKVNTFSLFEARNEECGYDQVVLLPRAFRAVIPSVLYLEGVPLSESEAQALLSRMKAANNADRSVYARYKFRIVYVEPLRRVQDISQTNAASSRREKASIAERNARLDAVLDSIEFYEDIDMTKLFYRYKPDGQKAKPL
ncbi:MAG: DUF4852 domain-containing protein [Alphaproteobacteria bacterium]|nr:DUF4852 domain-containing protein [Alphaproteobacteria bacterium]